MLRPLHRQDPPMAMLMVTQRSHQVSGSNEQSLGQRDRTRSKWFFLMKFVIILFFLHYNYSLLVIWVSTLLYVNPIFVSMCEIFQPGSNFQKPLTAVLIISWKLTHQVSKFKHYTFSGSIRSHYRGQVKLVVLGLVILYYMNGMYV